MEYVMGKFKRENKIKMEKKPYKIVHRRTFRFLFLWFFRLFSRNVFILWAVIWFKCYLRYGYTQYTVVNTKCIWFVRIRKKLRFFYISYEKTFYHLVRIIEHINMLNVECSVVKVDSRQSCTTCHRAYVNCKLRVES